MSNRLRDIPHSAESRLPAILYSTAQSLYTKFLPRLRAMQLTQRENKVEIFRLCAIQHRRESKQIRKYNWRGGGSKSREAVPLNEEFRNCVYFHPHPLLGV
jgi:hypothetical protein